MKDQKIIAEIKRGNTKVFKHLYDDFPKIRAFVLNNNGTSDDAKDLFQNALLVFFKKVKDDGAFELTSAISTYLFAICKNNWLKQISRKKEFNVEKMPHSTAEESTSPHLLDDIVAEMQDILSQVGEPCKQLILMIHYYKSPMEEVVEQMGYANAHTARQQKYKCLLKIRKLIPDSLTLKYRQHG